MKKKKPWSVFFTGVAVCLAALAVGLGLHLAFDRVHLRQIHITHAGELPAQPGEMFSYATVGAYPGFSDELVPWEAGQSGRDFYDLLGKYTYASIPLPCPWPGGLAVSTATGCSPEYAAYWDGLFLWLPTVQREKLVWRAYLPSSPWDLNENIKTLCNKYDIYH